MATDTTITVTVSYSVDQFDFVIENHRGIYPLKQLEELNLKLMTYDCHGYEVLDYTINTIDMYPASEAEHWDSIKDFLEQAKKNKVYQADQEYLYEEQCK
jgi:hypothetical protein